MNRKKLYDALTELKASASHSQFILVNTIKEGIDAIDAEAPARGYVIEAGLLGSAGAYAIAAERRRQVEAEGYDATHDDHHVNGELACAGAWYALPPESEQATTAGRLWPYDWELPKEPAYTDSTTDDQKLAMRKRELEKAGAMIAAEWDRLDRILARRP